MCRETSEKGGYLEDIKKEERSKAICRREKVTEPGWQEGIAECSHAKM